MRLTLYLFCFLCLAGSFTAKDKAPNLFELKGKIVSVVHLPSHCGFFAFATVFEVEIKSFSDPSYSRDTIPVIVPCPEFYGKPNFFKKGNCYKFKGSYERRSDFSYTVINNHLLDAYKQEHYFVCNKIRKR